MGGDILNSPKERGNEIMDAKRLTDIETHLMHQERTIQELNDVVIRQQQILEELAAEVAQLREQFRDLQPSAVGEPSAEESPPHY
jgi:uncharacterized coiled-coil protein SlyX